MFVSSFTGWVISEKGKLTSLWFPGWR